MLAGLPSSRFSQRWCAAAFYRLSKSADGLNRGTTFGSTLLTEPSHYRDPSGSMKESEGAHRPLLASFVGTLEIHGNGECAVCENGVLPRDLRIKTADELSRQCVTLAARRSIHTKILWSIIHTKAVWECIVVLDRLPVHRDNRSGLALAAGDELFLRPLRDAVFCPIVRGDSATSSDSTRPSEWDAY